MRTEKFWEEENSLQSETERKQDKNPSLTKVPSQGTFIDKNNG